jgi:hypothetical protein
MTSLLILSSLVYPLTLLRKRTSAASRRVFAYEYFVFLGRVTTPSAKLPFLEDPFVSLSLASHLTACPTREALPVTKVPAVIARKVIEARKPPPQQSGDIWGSIGTVNIKLSREGVL